MGIVENVYSSNVYKTFFAGMKYSLTGFILMECGQRQLKVGDRITFREVETVHRPMSYPRNAQLRLINKGGKTKAHTGNEFVTKVTRVIEMSEIDPKRFKKTIKAVYVSLVAKLS